MLQSFGGAGKGKNISCQLSSLRLVGGISCGNGLTPDLTVNGGAKIKGLLCANRITVRNDLIVQGNIFSSGSVCGIVLGDKTMLSDVSNIAPYSEYDPTTVMIEHLPCFGNISGVDFPSGTIHYDAGNISEKRLDVFQYSMLDYQCRNRHIITQLVCASPSISGPFLQRNCFTVNDVFQVPAAGTFTINYGSLLFVQGTYPIDWSTLTFLSGTTFNQDATGIFKTCEDWQTDPNVVYGTSTGSIAAPVVQAPNHFLYTVQGNPTDISVNSDNTGFIRLVAVLSPNGFQTEYFFKFEIQVADTMGNLSNVAELFVGQSQSS